mmetsp:Transcript_2881/g.8806  ORF Transcript_2881/g.8806 Transcript_2881/m.8806 type:complete len:356 (-) Transcript_2881:536-1603(-)
MPCRRQCLCLEQRSKLGGRSCSRRAVSARTTSQGRAAQAAGRRGGGWESMVENSGAGSVEKYVESRAVPGLKLLERTWAPESTPKCGMIIVHGHAWHTGWFAELANRLVTDLQCHVQAHDQISHGKSESLDGIRGFILSYDQYVEDLVAAVDRLRSKLPKGSPIFVLGESAGGMTVAQFGLRPDVADKVKGVILCAPALGVAPEVLPPWPVLKAVQYIGRFFPKLRVPGDEVSGDTWDRAFGDPALAKLSKEDPLTNYGVPTRMGNAVAHFSAMDTISSDVEKFSVANVLVLHNREDCRTPFSNSEQFISRVQVSGEKKLVSFDSTGHQIFQDTEKVRNEAIQAVEDFIRRVLSE